MEANSIISLVALISVGLTLANFAGYTSAHFGIPPPVPAPKEYSDLYNKLNDLKPWSLEEASDILHKANGDEMIGNLSVNQILSFENVPGYKCTIEEFKKFLDYRRDACQNSGVEKFIYHYRLDWEQNCGSKLDTIAKSAANSIKGDLNDIKKVMKRIKSANRNYEQGSDVRSSAREVGLNIRDACERALEVHHVITAATNPQYWSKVFAPELRQLCRSFMHKKGAAELQGRFQAVCWRNGANTGPKKNKSK